MPPPAASGLALAASAADIGDYELRGRSGAKSASAAPLTRAWALSSCLAPVGRHLVERSGVVFPMGRGRLLRGFVSEGFRLAQRPSAPQVLISESPQTKHDCSSETLGRGHTRTNYRSPGFRLVRMPRLASAVIQMVAIAFYGASSYGRCGHCWPSGRLHAYYYILMSMWGGASVELD